MSDIADEEEIEITPAMMRREGPRTIFALISTVGLRPARETVLGLRLLAQNPHLAHEPIPGTGT